MKLKVGDICVGHSFVYSTELNGVECTVEATPSYEYVASVMTGEVSLKYVAKVSWANGHKAVWPSPEKLKLKRPPSWDKWLTDTSHVKDEGDLPVPSKLNALG